MWRQHSGQSHCYASKIPDANSQCECCSHSVCFCGCQETHQQNAIIIKVWPKIPNGRAVTATNYYYLPCSAERERERNPSAHRNEIIIRPTNEESMSERMNGTTMGWQIAKRQPDTEKLKRLSLACDGWTRHSSAICQTSNLPLREFILKVDGDDEHGRRRRIFLGKCREEDEGGGKMCELSGRTNGEFI